MKSLTDIVHLRIVIMNLSYNQDTSKTYCFDIFSLFYQLSTKFSLNIDIFMYLIIKFPTYRGQLQWYKVLLVLNCPPFPT